MHSEDLKLLTESIKECISILEDSKTPIMSQPYLSLEMEAQASYLASLKSGISEATTALLELARRCHATTLLWESVEEMKYARDVEIAEICAVRNPKPDSYTYE